MEIIYKIGNMLKGSELVRIHSVNMQLKMNSGIAKEIRETYPEVYKDYMKQGRLGKLKLGEIFPVICDDTIIINAVGQQYYGYDDKQYASYDAIRECLKKTNAFLKEYDIKEIALPKIGAARGGLKWDKVVDIIEEEFIDAQPVVYVLNESELPLQV